MDRVPTSQPKPTPEIPDYEVLKQIGFGSYGEVWLCRSATGVMRAVKIVRRDRFLDDRPFEREFKGIQAFEPVSRTHQSQVDILHVGRGDGLFYYVMEAADDAFHGTQIDEDHYSPDTLSKRLLEKGRIEADTCIEIALALTTALQHLHDNGLVHRDVKPSNIIFVEGRAKLADIGLVSSADATMSVVGTEGFIPPEGPGSPRADLYSLGKVLYEASTGLDRMNFPELPADLENIPDREKLLELNAIINQACRQQADERYPNAGAMQADLVHLQQGRSIRRSQLLECQLRRFKRAAVFLAVMTAIGLVAWGYQKQQTDEKERLSKLYQDAAKEAQNKADESRDRLIRFIDVNAFREMEAGDPGLAALWSMEALALAPEASHESQVQQRRTALLLQQSPALRYLKPIYSADIDTSWSNLIINTTNDNARLLDPLTGTLKKRIGPLDVGDGSGTLSQDGSRVMFSFGFDEASEVSVWDVETGLLVWRFLHAPDFSPPVMLNAHVLGPKGRYCLFMENYRRFYSEADMLHHRIVLWDLDVRSEPQILADYPADMCPVSAYFSPGGDRICVTTMQLPPGGMLTPDSEPSGELRIWDIQAKRWLAEPFRAVGSTFEEIAWSPDGSKFLHTAEVISGAQSVHVFDTETFEVLTPPLSHPESIDSVVFSHHGDFVVTASRDKSIRVWDTNSGQPISEPIKHAEGPVRMAVSPSDDLIAVQTWDSRVHLWMIPQGKKLTSSLHHMFDLRGMSWSPDGRFLMTHSERLMRIWDLTNLLQAGHVISTKGPVGKIIFTGEDTVLISTPHHGAVVEWNISDGSNEKKYGSNPSQTISDIHRDGKHIVIGDRNTGLIRWFPLHGSSDSHKEINHPGQMIDLQFLESGDHFLTHGADQQLRVWKMSEPQRPAINLTHSSIQDLGTFMSVGSKDGNYLATADARNLVVWDLRDKEPQLCFAKSWAPPRSLGAPEGIQQLQFTPDGSKLIICNQESNVRMLRIPDGTDLSPEAWQDDGVIGFDMSVDGSLLATARLDRVVRIWNVEHQTLHGRELKTSSQTRSVSFHPDGSILLSAGTNGTIRFWDVASCTPLSADMYPGADLRIESSDIDLVGFINAGSQYYVALKNGQVLIRDFEPTLDVPSPTLNRVHRLNSRRIDDGSRLENLSVEQLIQ